MKGELLSIGEMSKMKGVGVKSLRYYERIGILKPAYVNPKSGYRYYSMRQMAELDVIISCIDLGIPLRQLRTYRDSTGTMDLASLLERGRETALANLRQAEVTLKQWDDYLEEAQTQKALSKASDAYERTLPARAMLCEPWEQRKFDFKRYVTSTTALYEQAKAAGLVPLYAQGLIRTDGETDAPQSSPSPGWNTFVCVAAPSWLTPEKARIAAESAGTGRLARLPQGTFQGRRIKGASLAACFDQVLLLCENARFPLIATEVWDAGLGNADYVVEVLTR